MNRSNIKVVGNTTTGTNLGSGAGVFKCKIDGNNLLFKSISVVGGLSIITGDTTITICGGGSGTITGGTNGLHVNGKNILLGGVFTGATLDNTIGGDILKYAVSPIFNNPSEIVDKNYVDAVARGLDPKLAVQVATIGDTVLSGLITIDGFALTTGDRVLVKNQISAATNGIYSANTGTWGRTNDFNSSGNTVQGSLIPVITGSTNKNTIWVLITPNPIIVGTTVMVFSLFSTVALTAGNSIVISGSIINVDMSTGTLANVLTGATNGLTTIGRNINLGGTITAPIAITGSSKITLGAIGRNIISDPIASTVCLGGTSNYISTTPTGTCINSGSGVLNIQSNNITVNGVNMKYCAHPTFTGSTQIVDKKYVDDQTTGSTTYSSASPSTVTVGGMPASTVLIGRSLESILEEILVEYLAPSFSSFSTAGIPATVEVGCVISGSKSFTFGFTNASNICANTLSIRDVTLGSNIATACSISSPQSATIASYTATTCGQQQSWCGCARNTCGTCFGSGSYIVSALLPYYWGIVSVPGPAGVGRPTAASINVTGGTRVFAGSSSPITIGFNGVATPNSYLWFAVPNTVSKTTWYVSSFSFGNISGAVGVGGGFNLFPAPDVKTVSSTLYTTWSKSYNVYVSNWQTQPDAGMLIS